jgi:hypothetical protein
MDKFWVPNSMEKTCLEHLDRVDNWKLLRAERPEETVILPWKPFRRIFLYNVSLFVLIFAVLFTVIGFGSRVGSEELKDDLLMGAVLTIVISSLMALYVTGLYRRTWNKRARWLGSQVDE